MRIKQTLNTGGLRTSHSSARTRIPLLAVAAFACLALALVVTPGHAATRWSTTYGGPSTYEGPLDLRELPDGSILVGGHTDSFGTHTGDAWWIHIDADGAVLEEWVYGNALPGGVADIAIDPDGGMVAVGAHTLDLYADRDAWVHHVDSAGEIDWQWGFDAPGLHAFYAVAATADAGYIATGSSALSDAGPFYAWVVKLEDAGSVAWQRCYHGGGGEHANFVVQTQDGGYAVAGWTTSSGAGSTDAWLLKISSTAVIEWQKTYGGRDQEEATGLIQTADGGYALVALTSTFPASGFGAWILRLRSNGEVLWHALMGDEWADFRNVMQTAAGDLIATGRISRPMSNDLWVVKFRDSDGTILWQRCYEGNLGDWGSQTLELADGDLLIGGIWAWGFAEEDIWLQRTDSAGRIADCPLIHDTGIETTSPEITVQDAVTVASPPDPIAEAITFVRNASALTIEDKCRAASVDPDPGDYAAPLDLLSVAPHPVRNSATITFRLAAAARISIGLHDANGRRLDTLAEGVYPAGPHHLPWAARRGRELPTGTYYLTLECAGEVCGRRAIIVR